MTNRRALELLCIELACVRRASGMEYQIQYGDDGCSMKEGWVKVGDGCDRNCATCPLVQSSEELLEMYNFMILKMISEEEQELHDESWKDWQKQPYAMNI